MTNKLSRFMEENRTHGKRQGVEDTTPNEWNSGFDGHLKGKTSPRRIRTV